MTQEDKGPLGISVVIPTHNRPVEAEAAVRSVLAQDYDGPLEVIVVFDGEDPRDLPVPDRPNFECRGIRNDRTRGLAGARNAGILAAKHPFVAFLDDDDEWLPGRLTPQLDIFREHPETVLVGGGISAVTAHGEFERLCPEIVTHRDLLLERVTELHSCTYVIRRSDLLGRLGLVDEELPGSFGEDYDLILRASKLAPIRAVQRPVARINWVGQSYFIATWERNAQAIQMLLAKHDFASEPKGLARMEGYVAYCLAAAGKSKEARVVAKRTLRTKPLEKRALFALMISLGLVTPERLGKLAARLGYRW